MHQDHGKSEATCASAIRYGFTSVMMDGSLKADGKTPADYEYNVDVTAEVVASRPLGRRLGRGRTRRARLARNRRGREEDGHGAEGKLGHDQLLTDPDAGAGFRRRAPRSTRSPSPSAPRTAPISSPRKPTSDVLAMNVIEEIHAKLPNTHLVMHGSSSVPQEYRGRLQRGRRRDARDLGRAGRRDRARHQISACARSTSTPTAHRHDGRDPPRRQQEQVANSTRANISSPRRTP